MTDASNPPANDLEAQLEALMKQAREDGGGASETQAEAPAPEANTATVDDPPVAEEPADLASQLDVLMAKVGRDESAEPEAAPPQEDAADEAIGTDVIADGPADVEDALDELEGAFDAVQDVIEAFDENAAPAPEPASEPTTKAATGETQTQLQQRDDDLAAQLQSLLDETDTEEADHFASPDELLAENAEAKPNDANAESDDVTEEDDGLDGDFDSTVEDIIAEAAAAEAASPPAAPASAGTDNGPSTTPDDPPLIDQLDSLLADHAEDALSGEFESVDDLLGVSETADENAADPDDALDEDEQEDEDDLGGDFQSMDDLLTKPEAPEPEPAEVKVEAEAEVEAPLAAMPPAEPRREEPALELDEIDGLFEAPTAMPASPSAAAPAEAAIKNEAQADEDGEEEAGGFESLDALFSAAPPSDQDRDGAPPAAQKKAKAKAKPPAEGWSITLNLAVLQAAAALLLGWTLWTCAMANKPIDKLPDDIKQAVGWVALAVAGPGVLLVVYGLLFN